VINWFQTTTTSRGAAAAAIAAREKKLLSHEVARPIQQSPIAARS
jgi:hypothetical protein